MGKSEKNGGGGVLQRLYSSRVSAASSAHGLRTWPMFRSSSASSFSTESMDRPNREQSRLVGPTQEVIV